MTERFTPAFNYRRPYFDGIGNKIEGKATYEDALRIGKLDYTVERRELYCTNPTANGYSMTKVPNKFATVRTDTNAVLGVVGKDYRIIQNCDSFSFVEDMLDNGVGVEAAGNFGKDGGHCFILAQGEKMEILGDEVSNHIFISNSFDGGAAIKAMFTPVRLVCANGLVIIDEKRATVKFTVGHYRNAEERLKEVKELMVKNYQYMLLVKHYAEYLASIAYSEDEFNALCERLFPVREDEQNERATAVREKRIAQLKAAYQADDLANFTGTAYKAIMAISDYESHGEPAVKRAKTVDEFHLRATIGGMVLLNNAIKQIQAQAGYRARVTL